MRDIRTVICHQTDTETATVATVRRYHMTPESEGGPPGGPWSDIGYHYLVQPDGTWAKGRPNYKIGSHCRGDNGRSLGVCFVGEGKAFPLGVGYMTEAQFLTGLRLIGRLIRAYPMARMGLFGHNEMHSGIVQHKSCPGFNCSILRGLLT